MDKLGGKALHANMKSREFLNAWREECDLIDIWRHMDPNTDGALNIKCLLDWNCSYPWLLLGLYTLVQSSQVAVLTTL